MSDQANRPETATTKATRATTTDVSASELMRTTKRRGPRWRTPERRPSVIYRGSVDDLLMTATGLSASQVHQLRFRWPRLLAKAVTALRSAGHIEAAAQLLAPIEEAAGSQLALDLKAAKLDEARAEAECDVAELRAELEPSDSNVRLMLRASANEVRLQTERDARVREQLDERNA